MSSADLTIRVAGRIIPTNVFDVRAMNFGQVAPGQVPVPCEVTLRLATLLGELEGEYRDYAADDVQHGGGETDKTVLRLRGLGWPVLDRLAVDDPALLVDFLLQWMDTAVADALGRLLSPRGTAKFYLNSVLAIEVSGKNVTIKGQALAA